MGIEGTTKSKRWKPAQLPYRISLAKRYNVCVRPIIFRCPISPSNRALPNRSLVRSSAMRPTRLLPRSGAFRKPSMSRSNGAAGG